MPDFKLPELGENVHGGDVLRVLVKNGDAVKADQPVLELETDKATIEVPSSMAGIVGEVKVRPGEKVKVGQVIFTMSGNGAAANEADDAKPEAERPNAEAESRPAAVVHAPAPIARQPEDEIVDAPKPRRGEVVDIGRGARVAVASTPPPGDAGPAPAAAPSVRRIARELGVDVRQVSGTGANGRITVEDVQAYVRSVMEGGATGLAAAAAAPSAQPLPDFSKWGEIEAAPINNIRRKTAEHLSHVWNTIPAVTQYDKADITALEELRKKYSPMAEKAGGKMTVTAIALKVLAGAVQKFPHFAASLDLQRGQLIYKKYSNIGVAVDTSRGLLVAVIRDVDRKGLVELSGELAKISEKARAGKLSLEDMSGGVITISNLGGIGGVGFSPIVNWPDVAILGISRGSIEPVWEGKQFQPRLMLPLSLSYDHRVIDGADAARFLRWVAEAFENPFVLSL
jgi:pyruvate dehydrogenase E2 component (dihydrolipoamide acetyltransferase)